MKWLVSYPENPASVEWYARWVQACGAEPVFTESPGPLRYDPSGYDALLLSGGGDVDPARYGESPHAKTGGLSSTRDTLECGLLADFRAAGLPVFGICRGAQAINVFLGGGLIQHVPDRIDPALEEHRRPESYAARHALRAVTGTVLGRALASVGETNSSHHQAVDPDRLGRGIQVAAWSGLGSVEAIEGEGCSGVQWHPERLPLEHQASALLRACWAGIARG